MSGELVVWAYVLDAYEGGLPSASYLGVLADAAEAADAPDDYVAAPPSSRLPFDRPVTTHGRPRSSQAVSAMSTSPTRGMSGTDAMGTHSA